MWQAACTECDFTSSGSLSHSLMCCLTWYCYYRGVHKSFCFDCASDHVFSNTCRPPRALQTFLNLLSTQPSISTFGLDCWSLNRLDLNWDTLGNNSFNNICTIWMSALENTCRQHILREVLTSQLEQMQSDLRSTQIKMSGIPYKGVYCPWAHSSRITANILATKICLFLFMTFSKPK